jgi:hypothetical protein
MSCHLWGIRKLPDFKWQAGQHDCRTRRRTATPLPMAATAASCSSSTSPVTWGRVAPINSQNPTPNNSQNDTGAWLGRRERSGAVARGRSGAPHSPVPVLPAAAGQAGLGARSSVCRLRIDRRMNRGPCHGIVTSGGIIADGRRNCLNSWPKPRVVYQLCSRRWVPAFMVFALPSRHVAGL